MLMDYSIKRKSLYKVLKNFLLIFFSKSPNIFPFRAIIIANKKTVEAIVLSKYIIFTKEVKDFVYQNYKGHTHKEMAELINRKFNLNINPQQVNSFYCRMHLHCGFTGRFEIGNVPKNKGWTFEQCFKNPEIRAKIIASRFQKGRRSERYQPIGTETIRHKNATPYIYIKIKDPDVWITKHRYLYEKYNNVKLTSNDIVTFLDGDTFNFSKNNLVLIDKKINAGLNRHKRSNDAIINKTLIAYVGLAQSIARKKRQIKEGEKN